MRKVIEYFHFLRKARTRYSIHSPFVYDLYTNVIHGKSLPENVREIENLRKILKKDKTIFEYSDHGAGHGTTLIQKDHLQVRNVVQRSAISKKYGGLLFRLARKFNTINCIELGTSLGFSTMYLAGAGQDTVVHTIEGCKNTAEFASGNFNKLSLNNIKLHTGQFDNTLPSILEETDKLDLLFVDGNHKFSSTINYFNMCMEKAHDNSIFIFDDIRWSAGMKKAWESIRDNKKVTVSLDLFNMGIVLFRKESSKENILINF